MARDLVELRRTVELAVRGLASYTHRELDELCPRLGLPPLLAEGSKRDRLEACLADLNDEDLAEVARRILDAKPISLSRADQVALEDALWATRPAVEIPGRVRREIAHTVDVTDLVYRADRFERLLDQWWVLDDDPLAAWTGSSTRSLRAQITRHVFRNKDWSTEELFERLGAFDAGDARFGRFLEGLVSPETVPDAPTQARIVESMNPVLWQAGARLEQTGTRDGYPCFELLPAGAGPRRRPKNLIFASSRKPDIRFLDAVDNDIEVLQGSEEVLVYDRPIGADGIRWRDLQQWWQDTQGISDDAQGKSTLYARLIAAMPSLDTSPQAHLFHLYHEIHGRLIPELPALLPEVWLHWDHKTVAQRGSDALLRFRMDFLLLLPQGRRVVLEVDGAHHYAGSGNYTAGVRGDRDLKLSGYEVFRFSSTELSDIDQARLLLREFFARLFDHYEVTLPQR